MLKFYEYFTKQKVSEMLKKKFESLKSCDVPLRSFFENNSEIFVFDAKKIIYPSVDLKLFHVCATFIFCFIKCFRSHICNFSCAEKNSLFRRILLNSFVRWRLNRQMNRAKVINIFIIVAVHHAYCLPSSKVLHENAMDSNLHQIKKRSADPLDLVVIISKFFTVTEPVSTLTSVGRQNFRLENSFVLFPGDGMFPGTKWWVHVKC